MTDIVICYTGKSSVTGRALYDRLRLDSRFRKVRKVTKNKRIRNTDVFLRWGNASSFNPDNCIQINTKESIVNSSSKGRMIRLLSEAGVPVPNFRYVRHLNAMSDDDKQEVLANLSDDDGKLFIRGADKKIRYDDELLPDDIYILQPIDKRREYRVHVFDGEVTAIYEKIPNEGETGTIRKDHNCKFSRCNPENTRCNKEAQQICIDAVNALGLTFGGVDIIRERRPEGQEKFNFYVTEVNSSPALNSVNIEKYVDKILEYIEDNTQEET